MTTTLSSKGQLVLPKEAREKMQLEAGTTFDCEVKDGMILLTPHHAPPTKTQRSKDPISGLTVAKKTKGKSTVNSDTIRRFLSEFP